MDPTGGGFGQFLFEGGILLIIAVLFASMIGLVVWGVLRARKRREELATYAAEKGWTYVERDDRFANRWSGAPFNQGHNRKAGNILQGQYDGRDFTAFDFVYYTTETDTDSEGRSRTREVAHHYSVIGLVHGAQLPSLTVRPEGPVGRLFGRLTNTDLQFESDAFNRAFTVNAKDRRFASDVIHPRMMEVLLTTPKAAFRFEGDAVLSVHSGTHSLTDLESRLGLLDTVLDQVPDFVWRQAAAQRPHEGPHRGPYQGTHPPHQETP